MHPAIDQRHQAISFRSRKEFRRQDGLAVVVQPHEYFHRRAADRTRPGRLDRLQVELEESVAQRRLQTLQPVDFAAAARDGFVMRGIDVDVAAGLPLRDIAGRIGRIHDLFERIALAGHFDEPDADADAEDAVLPDEAVFADRAPDVVGDLARLVERAADQQHAELVAAEARHGVRVAHRLADQRRDLAQHVVAREVAAGVVDRLEAIEVQIAHHVALPARARDFERLAEAALEFAAIDQPGQRVVARLVGHLLRQAAQFADVVQHHGGAGDLPFLAADRRCRCLDADFIAGRARDHQRAPAERGAVSGTQALLDGIRQRAAIVLVDETRAAR